MASGGPDRAVRGVVEVEAAGVVGALVPCHDEAVVEGGADRSDVVILARERHVVDDVIKIVGAPSASGRTNKQGWKSLCWNPSVSTRYVRKVIAHHLPLTGCP